MEVFAIRYRFLDFVFDEENRELTGSGKASLLPMQEARVLETLLSSAGATVSKQQLARRLWPEEQYGDFDRAINNIVSKLRRTLGEGGSDSRCIQTIPKAGYRLLCAVTVDAPLASPLKPAEAPGSEPDVSATARPDAEISPRALETDAVQGQLEPARARRSRLFRWYLPLSSCMMIALGGALYLYTRHLHRLQAVEVTTIGILPIEVSNDATPGAGEALRGELADAIAQIPGVQVRAAHSLTSEMAHDDLALRQAARRFSLDILVVGSLAIKKDSYELNLELVRGWDGIHLRSFHCGGPSIGMPAAPAEIEKSIFNLIVRPGISFSSAQNAQGSTANLDAYGFYFQGSQALAERTQPSVQQATELFRQAIRLDPQFAKAYSGLAESYLVLADFASGPHVEGNFEQTRTAATQALHLNPMDAQAHSVLGLLLLQHDWKLAAAEDELRSAIRLNSGLAANHMRLAVLLADRKEFAGAVAEIDIAHQLDPLWPVVYGTGLYVDIMGRRYANAIRDGHELVSMRPNWGRAHQQHGWALWYSGKHADAIQEWRQAAILDKDSARQRLEEDGLKLLNEQGVRAYAHFKLKSLGEHSTDSDFVPAEWHAFAGDRAETLAALSVMVERHDPESLKIPINPAYDFLRSDPQYDALLSKVVSSVS